jgi:putative transposase
MPLRQRRTLPHEPPLSVRTDNAVFFLTICCDPRSHNQLCHPEVSRRLFEAMAFYNDAGQWWAHFALLMPDHLHMLTSFPESGRARSPNAPRRTPTMAAVISALKRYTARQFGIHWQRDFFDHRLRGDDSAREKEEYIRQNPVRAGLVKTADDWPYVWWPERAAQ